MEKTNGVSAATAAKGGSVQKTERKEEFDVHNVSDGWITMEREIKRSELQIKEYLKDLHRDNLERIVIELAAQGNGSLDYLKDALSAATPEQENVPTEVGPDWCNCGYCITMDAHVENKCCGLNKCVTSYQLFTKHCLDKDNLVMYIKAWCDIRADVFDFSTINLRKAAYRQYLLWKYGKLGKSNKRVIPSCVVRCVCQTFKNHDGS